MNVLVTKLQIMIGAGERKGRTNILNVYGVALRAPAITTRQGTQHGHQNKKAYRDNNYQ